MLIQKKQFFQVHLMGWICGCRKCEGDEGRDIVSKMKNVTWEKVWKYYQYSSRHRKDSNKPTYSQYA